MTHTHDGPRPADALLDRADWRPLDPPVPEVLAAAPGVPHATHEAHIVVAGRSVRALRLSDGRRVLAPDDGLNRLMGDPG